MRTWARRFKEKFFDVVREGVVLETVEKSRRVTDKEYIEGAASEKLSRLKKRVGG